MIFTDPQIKRSCRQHVGCSLGLGVTIGEVDFSDQGKPVDAPEPWTWRIPRTRSASWGPRWLAPGPSTSGTSSRGRTSSA